MFENEELSFDCPGCGAKNTIKVGDVKTVSEVTCPGCGDQIKIEAKGFKDALRQVDLAFSDFEQAIADLNKRGKRR